MSLENTEVLKRIVDEASRFVVGRKKVMEMLLIALLSGGHVLLEGPPGVGKTLLAKTFAKAIGGTFKRIQMTPDLLPADIIGVYVYNPKDGGFSLKRGPIFANVILADELNRATPKTQSALLEAMQELQVTIEGNTLPLERPFIVLATMVPYGSVGTYQLTEVQIDRFAFKVNVGLPEADEELEIISRIDSIESEITRNVASLDEIVELMAKTREVFVSDKVKNYIVDLVNYVRNTNGVKIPPSPRASIWLYKASRAKALIEGRDFVIPDDVKDVAPYVFAHRIRLEPEIEENGKAIEEVIKRALREKEVPKD